MTKGDGQFQKFIVALLAWMTARLEILRGRLHRLERNSDAGAREMSARLEALSTKLDSDAATRLRKPLVPRLIPQLAVLLTAFGVLLYVGFRFQPDDDSLKPFGTQELMVDVAVRPLDDNGLPISNSPTFDGLIWVESHGEVLDGYDLKPVISPPEPDQDTVRILLNASYGGALPIGSNLSLSLDLPTNAEIEHCDTVPGFKCTPVERKATASRSARALQISGKVLADSEGRTYSNGIIVSADFKNIPGFAFTYSQTSALVRQPTITLTGTEYLPPPGSIRENAAPDDPYRYVFYRPSDIITQIIFNTAPDFKFSLTPGSLATDRGDFAPVTVNGVTSPASKVPRATWAFQQPIMPTTYSPPQITGTNQKALDKNSNDIFIAGVLFGVAGGAGVNALQLFVTGARRRWKAH